MSNDVSSQRVGTWLTSLLEKPPLTLILVGSALILMAATGGVPAWSLVLSDPPWRIAVAVLGLVLIATGVVWLLTPRIANRGGPAFRDAKVPTALARSLRLPFLARRAELTRSQRALLDFIEQETRQRAAIPQQELEERFKLEVFWRLETLCYLGFCEKEIAGKQSVYDKYNYRLSSAYRKALQHKRPEE